MTIGKKIGVGVGLALAVLVVLGLLSYLGAVKLSETSRANLENSRMVAHTHEVLTDLEALLSTMKDAETGQRGYLLTGEEPYLEPYKAALLKLDQILKNLRQLTIDNRNQQGRLDALGPLVEQKLDELKETIELRKKSGSLESGLKMVKTDRGKKLMDDARKIIGEMTDDENGLLKQRDAEAEASAQAAEGTAHFTRYAIGLGTILAFLVLSVGGFFLGRSITGPVRAAVSRLTSSGAELLASTQQQAAGAQEQAAAVTQTVATVDEVTQTADQSAQRAKSVGEAVQRNLEIGKAGRQVVENSSAALGKVQEQVEATAENILALAEQAQAIGEIIATVNDIAEQTNLLALNAAIEASRAGEHGKGFSVVAGEVKVLADQSKKATAQVRQILGEIQKATNTAVLSTEEVTKGVAAAAKVGGQAGETIKALVDTLAEAAQTAVQIVASAGQQAAGMAQIHQAMKNIDQVAKQNLGAMRQVEEAARNLNVLGTQFAGLVGG